VCVFYLCFFIFRVTSFTLIIVYTILILLPIFSRKIVYLCMHFLCDKVKLVNGERKRERRRERVDLSTVSDRNNKIKKLPHDGVKFTQVLSI